MLVMTSLLTRPPALRITGVFSSGPKNCSGTTRGSKQVTGDHSGQQWFCQTELRFRVDGKSVDRRMRSLPPELNALERICSIVAGFFHVFANSRFFSRKPWILESMPAMVASALLYIVL